MGQRMIALADLAHAPTSPFEPTDAHAVLQRCVGSWRGTTRLWLDPDAAPEETLTELRAQLILGGRWLRLEYVGTAFGKPHAGEMLLGFHADAGEYELAWVDSSHTGSAIMLSTGRLSSLPVVDVVGSYRAGTERWGWRTKLHCPSPGELALDAFNISPQGKEDRAIETRLTRSAGERG
jgi:hypothetical protein